MSNTDRVDPALLAGNRKQLAGYQATHFLWEVKEGVATVTLNRPERKNPLTFESYAELRDLFGQLRYATDVHAVVVTGAGGNFCSGGDVHEIIGPLVKLKAPELLMFTRMTGDLVKAMRACPQPIVAAIDGICAGAGAIVAMASDLRLGTARSKTAFLFNRVGLAGCDMGACATPAVRWAARRASAGDFSTGFARPRRCWPRRRRWRATWPRVRPSPTASPRPCCTRSGR
jgi:enoyl-CoA hydratase/carnithine racemase